jgi:hypothetical protein
VSGENWHEERDRLVQLLEDIESGAVTRMYEGDLPELQATTPENVAVLKVRLAQLNARLGDQQATNRKKRSRSSSTEDKPSGQSSSTDAT